LVVYLLVPLQYTTLEYKWCSATSFQCPVEVECRTDQRQVGKCLEEIAKGLATRTGLFRIESQVIAIGEHLLEHEPCLVYTPFFAVTIASASSWSDLATLTFVISSFVSASKK